jgi:CMP-N,N'-diacetyllegionaminic acid synthase
MSANSLLGFIPARGGSKGIPRKNLRLLGGRPLLAHTIEAALRAGTLDRILVNTEDDEIADVARSLGVPVQGRPEEFWHDDTFQEVDRLLQWAVADHEREAGRVDVVVLLYPTSPLRPSAAIDATVRLVTEGSCDSALTLAESRQYLWRRTAADKHEAITAVGDVDLGLVEPTNYDPARRGPNQLEGWNQWIENKAVYAMRRDLLMETGCRLGGRIGGVRMSRTESIDVDTPDDLALAEAVLRSRGIGTEQ